MKLRISLIISLLMSVVASCAKDVPMDANFDIKPDSAVYATLGRTISETLFSPKKVTCYLLTAKRKVGKNDIEIEDHYVRDEMVRKLTKEQIAILQFDLLASQRNYEIDSVRIRSPYAPTIEFCFEKKNNVVHVLISLSDYTWTLFYDDKRQGHWNYADKKLIDRYCEMILGDLYDKAN